jgi:hypothetical protein
VGKKEAKKSAVTVIHKESNLKKLEVQIVK